MPELELLSELPGHDDPAWRVAFNPQRNLLASCSTDRTVRLYSYSGSEFQFLSSVPTGHKRTVRALAWSPSGSTFATASFDSTVSIWEEEDGDWECVTTLEGHENEAKDVGWSAEGGLLASVSRDRSCWVWELLRQCVVGYADSSGSGLRVYRRADGSYCRCQGCSLAPQRGGKRTMARLTRDPRICKLRLLHPSHVRRPRWRLGTIPEASAAIAPS